MKTVITDAGRSESHPEEYSDCAVRAMATAFSVPYPTAHAFCKGLGRQDKCSISSGLLKLGAMESVGEDWTEGCSIELFSKFHKRGTYLLILWNGWSFGAHIVCMRDSVAYDTEIPQGNVWLAWRVPSGASLVNKT